MKKSIIMMVISVMLLQSIHIQGSSTIATSNEVRGLSFASDESTESNNVSALMDQDTGTAFTVDLSVSNPINVTVNTKNNTRLFLNMDKIVLYASNSTADNLTGVTVKIDANDRGHQETIVNNFSPVWVEENGIKKMEIIVPAVVCRQFWIELSGSSTVGIREVVVEGTAYNNSLESIVSYKKNGTVQNPNVLFDQNIDSYDLVVTGDQLVFDFSPNKVNLSEFAFVCNFPDIQSVASGSLEYWDGTNWQTIETNKVFDFEKKNSQARAVGAFTFNSVTTTQLRFTVNDCEDDWGKTLIQEIFIDGQREDLVEGILASSDMVTTYGEVGNIVDNDKTTSWQTTLSTDGLIELYTENTESGKYNNFKNEKIVLYALGDVPSSMTVSVDQFVNYNYETILSNQAINWIIEGGCRKGEIELPFDTASHKYRLRLNGTGQLQLAEAEVVGENYISNLSEFSTIYKNSNPLSSKAVYDTDLSTLLGGIGSGDELVFDFSPYECALESFYFTMNFPKEQTVASGSIAYWNGSTWVSLSEVDTFDWQTNNQIREVQGFEFDQITTSKIKFTVGSVNSTWAPAIQEIFMNGEQLETSQSLAATIKMPVQERNATELIFPELPANGYTLEISSSSVPSVVDVQGNIVPPSNITQVDLVFQVTQISTGNTALTDVITAIIPTKTPDGHVRMVPEEDMNSFIKNPGMGWVAYVEYSCMIHEEKNEHPDCVDADDVDEYFRQLDIEIAKGLKPSILYMRMGWQWYEPNKDEYAWRDPNSKMSQYIEKAKEREMQIAFRILSSDDYYGNDNEDLNDPSQDDGTQTVPPWLFREAGFDYYTNPEGNKTPYYDNPTYLTRYEKLVSELAKDFDDPNLVAFIDSQGLGMWGEMHGIEVIGNKEDAIVRHAEIWTENFQNVLLGATFGGGVDGINETRIVPDFQHMVRRDAFGSKWLTPDFQSLYLEELFPAKIPMYGEVAYWHLTDEYIKKCFPQDSNLVYTGNIADDCRGYFEFAIQQAQALRANTLDCRVPSDWLKWTAYGTDLIDKFAIENGYRLVPVTFEYPETASSGDSISINHDWKNTALGFLPTANNQLQDKYKIAFALLDSNNSVVYQYTDQSIDPSWIKEDGDQLLTSQFQLPTSLASGQYKLAVAIVDTENSNNPGINLATMMTMIDLQSNTAVDPTTWYGGWYIINNQLTIQ